VEEFPALSQVHIRPHKIYFILKTNIGVVLIFLFFQHPQGLFVTGLSHYQKGKKATVSCKSHKSQSYRQIIEFKEKTLYPAPLYLI